MEITYYGANCVLLTTKPLKVLIDPVSGEYGPNPKVSADVTLFTQQPQQEVAASAGTTITFPGEYEMKSVSIEGVAARLHTEESAEKLEGVIYCLSYNGIRMVVCGNIHPELSEEQIEQLDGVDVLVVPVGGRGLTLDKEAAASLVRQFNPGAVVPVHFNDDQIEYPMPQADVSEFLHEMGVSELEPQDSFKVSARDTAEEINFVQLKPQKR